MKADWKAFFARLFWIATGALIVTALTDRVHHGLGWPHVVGTVAGPVFMIAFWGWVVVGTDEADRQRPDELRAVARALDLAYEGDSPKDGLDADALRMKPEPSRYLLRGSHHELPFFVTLGRIPDTEGDDEMWCVFVVLPAIFPDIGISTGGKGARPCSDWPHRTGMARWRAPEPSPFYREIVERPAMRQWLDQLPRHHFHVSGRWLLCQGPNVVVSSDRRFLKPQIAKEVAVAKRFIDLFPSDTAYRPSLWARPGD